LNEYIVERTMTDLAIAYLSPSLSRAAGGIFEVQHRLAQQLDALPQVSVAAYGTVDEELGEDVASWSPVAVHAYPYRGTAQFRWSPQLSKAFDRCEADVAHLHALWMHTSMIVRRWSRRHRRPYVTTVHGMLDSWALANSVLKKRLVAACFERECLAGAACLHALTENELRSIRDFGLKNAVCVIPNGVDLPPQTTPTETQSEAIPTEKKTLLYLGRLHPKKGLMNLLAGWRSVGRTSATASSDWSLVIAGWDQAGHEAELKERATSLGIAHKVRFAGPLFGADKSAAYAAADAFVLPSFSEGLPMTVLEAWSYGKPVLMTPQCNLPEGFAVGAAIEAQPDETSLVEGLAALLGATDDQRREMGRRGRDLVRQKFTWSRVAAEMLTVYRWLVGGGTPPTCVHGG